jgi:hypothetical protein
MEHAVDLSGLRPPTDRSVSINLRMIIVGYDQPTLWISVALATIVAVAAGSCIGIRIVRHAPGITRWAAGLWLGVLVAGASIVIAHALFSLLFLAATGAQACIPVVGRLFLVPAVAGVVSEASAWWFKARRADPA